MPWYNPTSWFSRSQAASAANNASTATLRNALIKYINATKNLKNKQSILSAINNKPAGSIRTYRNMIGNGVANAVVAAKGANLAVAAANAGAVSETVAAAHVNNAANKLANLNKYMNTISVYTNNKNKVNQYIATKRNLNANRALNAGRNGGPKYANFFKMVNTKKMGGNNQRQAAANAGAVPETAAAEAVRQAETAVNNLNKAIANINTTNFANNAAKESYRTKLKNIVRAKGIALNNARLTAAFNKINAKAFKKANNSANQHPANASAANAAAGVNNNMAIVNRAIATKELSELNSAKLLIATANKLKNSNNKNLKSNFVKFAKRQINTMNNENNKKKVRSAIMKVSPENNMFKQANNASQLVTENLKEKKK